MANPEQKRTGTIVLWVVGLVVAVAIFFTIRSLTREVVRVHVVPVTYQTITDTVATNGTVEPVSEFQAHAAGPGVIKKIFVDINQTVAAGAMLVQMDDADSKSRIATAHANLASAQLALDNIAHGGSLEERTRFGSDVSSARADQKTAADNLEQVKRLQQRGSASAAEVASAQQRLDTATLSLQTANTHSTTRYDSADRRSAESHVADAQAALTAANDAFNNANIRTPIAGTVYSIPFSAYDFVPSGESDIVNVADLKHLRVRAYFDEPEVGKLARGQAVKIVWDAKPNSTWHGHIETAPTAIIRYQSTRNVGECLITIDDVRGDLLPNTNVTVTVTRNQRFNVLSIPREALHTDGANDFVYRIVNNKLVRTPVVPGVVNLTSAEIVSGLKGNDIIVLGPADSGKELANGLEVKQVE